MKEWFRRKSDVVVLFVLALFLVFCELSFGEESPAPPSVGKEVESKTVPPTEAAVPPEEWPTEMIALDTVVAMVNGEAITLDDLQRYSNPVIEFHRKKGLRTTLKEKKQILERELEGLIDRKLILMEAKELGARIEESRVREVIFSLIELKATFNGDLAKYLVAKGLTYRQLYKDIEEQLLLGGMIQEKVVRKVRVSPAEIKERYERNIEKFTEEAAIHCFAISFMKRDNPEAAAVALTRAREALQKINQGAYFPDVAREYSEDPGHAQKGGDWGWITPGTLEKKASDAAFAVKEGEHSGIVEADAADWILWVKEKRDKSVIPLPAAWKEIELGIRAEKIETEIRRWGNRLRLKAAVTYPVPLSAILGR